MRVLVTGAGGNLGRVVVPALVAAGHTPRLFDFRAIETEYEFVQGDVRNAEDVRRAVAGVDAIVHAAALHGIHLEKWQPEDFWQINVTGTFNVFEAARREGVIDTATAQASAPLLWGAGAELAVAGAGDGAGWAEGGGGEQGTPVKDSAHRFWRYAGRTLNAHRRWR